LLDHPRLLAVMHAVVCFAHSAARNTFSTAEIHPYVVDVLGCPAEKYKLGSLRYELSKYRLTPEGYSMCLVFLKLFERIYGSPDLIPPLG
jgi:hypothetical protein